MQEHCIPGQVNSTTTSVGLPRRSISIFWITRHFATFSPSFAWSSIGYLNADNFARPMRDIREHLFTENVAGLKTGISGESVGGGERGSRS